MTAEFQKLKEEAKKLREENKKKRSLFERVIKTTYKNGFEEFKPEYTWMERELYNKEMKKYQEPIIPKSPESVVAEINITYEKVPLESPNRLYYYLHWLHTKVREIRDGDNPTGYEDHFEILISMFANRVFKKDFERKGDV